MAVAESYFRNQIPQHGWVFLLVPFGTTQKVREVPTQKANHPADTFLLGTLWSRMCKDLLPPPLDGWFLQWEVEQEPSLACLKLSQEGAPTPSGESTDGSGSK